MREEATTCNDVLWVVKLEQEGLPGFSVLNSRLPPGCQKFTSSRSGRSRRNRYQSRSVTATKARTGGILAESGLFHLWTDTPHAHFLEPGTTLKLTCLTEFLPLSGTGVVSHRLLADSVPSCRHPSS